MRRLFQNIENKERVDIMNYGYKVIIGENKYKHYFGGETWKMPICSICDEPVHQILTLDMTDIALSDVRCKLNELPLISCVNCSNCWGRQYYKLDESIKSITVLKSEQEEVWKQDGGDKIKYPLPKMHVKLEKLDAYDDDEFIDGMGTDYLAKIGGAPVFLSDTINMRCPKCGKYMEFIGQLTGNDFGDEKLLNGFDFFIGEMFLYYYICSECNIVGVDSQEL